MINEKYSGDRDRCEQQVRVHTHDTQTKAVREAHYKRGPLVREGAVE